MATAFREVANLDPSLQPTGGSGTGMGLAIDYKSLTDRHQGALVAAHNLEEGTGL